MQLKKEIQVPVWEKIALTIDEASAYSSIGENTLREILNAPDCPFVLFVGNRKLVKRKEFEKYISQRTTIV